MYKRFVAIPAILFAALLLFSLTLHPLRSQFAGVQTYAGTAGGSVNVLTLTVSNMSSMNDVIGVPITFFPSGTNTGPATINVSSFGNVNLRRPSGFGTLVAFSGAELNAGVLTTVVYDGTNLNLVAPVNPAPISSIIEGRFASAPAGYLIEDGSCISRTTFAPLFGVIGTTYGSCDGSTTFGLPDSRGASLFALDNQGVNGAANRLTSASGCTATSLVSTICGGQTQTLTLAQLPTGITSTGTFSGSMSGTASGAISVASTSNVVDQGVTAETTGGGGFGFNAVTSAGGITSTGTASLSASVSGNTSGTATSNNTSGTAHPIVPPASLIRRAIKF